MAAAAARVDALNETLDAYALLVAVYRNPDLTLQMRFDAACKALPYERAKPAQDHNHSGTITLDMLVGASMNKPAPPASEPAAKAE